MRILNRTRQTPKRTESSCDDVVVLLFADDIITSSICGSYQLACHKHDETTSLTKIDDVPAAVDKNVPAVVPDSDDCKSTESESSNSDSSVSSSSSISSFSTVNTETMLPGIIKFDCQNCLQPVTVLLLYIICHLSFYEIFSLCVYRLLDGMSYYSLQHVCMLVLGIFLLRITGGIFSYMNDDEWYRVKREFKERLHVHNSKELHKCTINERLKIQLVKLDKKSKNLFKRHKLKRQILEMAAYFLCHLFITHFNEKMISSFADITQDVVDGLPSATGPGALSLIGHRISRNKALLFPTPTTTTETLTIESSANEACPNESTFQSLLDPQRYVEEGVAKYFGDDVYFGIITNYTTAQGGLWHIRYEDKEEADWKYGELMEGLDLYQLKRADQGYNNDDLYLYDKLSRATYWGFMNDESHMFLKTSSVIIYHGIMLIASISLLSKIFGLGIWG